MFKNQPPYPASDDAARPTWVRPWRNSPPPTPAVLVTKRRQRPFNENPSPLLTSGFTFVGQFVDHDITFDTTTLSEQESDPDATTNFRTPRYDLDAIYGRGPAPDPQFYNPNDRDKFLIESVLTARSGAQGGDPSSQDLDVKPDVVYDVPRNADGTAKIADPRNDQTLIILQLHIAMQMFHNKLVDTCARVDTPGGSVRVGAASGPMALPVDGDPRVPARHRGHDNG